MCNNTVYKCNSVNLSHLWLLESRQTMSSDLSDVPRVTKNVAPGKKCFSILMQSLGRNIQVSKRLTDFYLLHLIHWIGWIKKLIEMLNWLTSAEYSSIKSWSLIMMFWITGPFTIAM